MNNLELQTRVTPARNSMHWAVHFNFFNLARGNSNAVSINTRTLI